MATPNPCADAREAGRLLVASYWSGARCQRRHARVLQPGGAHCHVFPERVVEARSDRSAVRAPWECTSFAESAVVALGREARPIPLARGGHRQTVGAAFWSGGLA